MTVPERRGYDRAIRDVVEWLTPSDDATASPEAVEICAALARKIRLRFGSSPETPKGGYVATTNADWVSEQLSQGADRALREALEFYANPLNWSCEMGEPSPVELDGGRSARSAVEAAPAEEERE